MYSSKGSCLDVCQYSSEFLKINDEFIRVPITYQKSWNDGFGARGWKLNASIGDPEIIASTRETGEKIPTSVFIHDILDHFLSGFGISGHRSEAMALIQLYKRTGSDPKPDYEQMVKEDLMNGIVHGEELISFISDDLRSLLDQNIKMSNKEIIAFLRDRLGETRLIESLVDNFFTLGKIGETHAIESWNKLSLDSDKRTEIGLALQKLLNKVDRIVEESGVELVKADISINNKNCVISLQDSSFAETVFSTNVA
jgi:hypothetical protein